MTPPLPRLPVRQATSHKGDFGRAILLGGSRGMSGAIGLSGMATLRSGAGLVRLAVPDVILPTVAAYEPCYMTWGLPSDSEGRIAEGAWEQLRSAFVDATCSACGPGLGRSHALDQLICAIYSTIATPLVVDADGLNALADFPHVIGQPGGPRVLTPHPGEFRRLSLGRFVELAPEVRAQKLAQEWRVVIVLKGVPTWVTDGAELVACSVGNPGLATGGSGDVLTGVITALLAQGLAPFAAALLGVHVHGWAGDLAAAELGQVGMIASDLIRFLPAAIRRSDSA